MIDAATSAEVTLTAGLNTPLSAEAFPRVAKALVDRTRMLSRHWRMEVRAWWRCPVGRLFRLVQTAAIGQVRPGEAPSTGLPCACGGAERRAGGVPWQASGAPRSLGCVSCWAVVW